MRRQPFVTGALLVFALSSACGDGAKPRDIQQFERMNNFSHYTRANAFDVEPSANHRNRIVQVWLACRIAVNASVRPDVDTIYGQDASTPPLTVLIGQAFYVHDSTGQHASRVSQNWLNVAAKRRNATLAFSRGGDLFYARRMYRRLVNGGFDSSVAGVTRTITLNLINTTGIIARDQDFGTDSSSYIAAHEVGHQLGVDHRSDPTFAMHLNSQGMGHKVSGAYANSLDTLPRPAGSDCWHARDGGREAHIFEGW